MLILGHVGITVAAAMASEAVFDHPNAGQRRAHVADLLRSTVLSLSSRMGLRWLVLASLLPDIIDKPLGLVLYSSTLSSGRLYCHTIWFPVVLLAASTVARRSRSRTILLVLSFGSAMHLLLDSMWRTPITLFWPIFGPFPHGNSPDQWLLTIIHHLLTDPRSYVPEIVGAILLLPLLVVILRERRRKYS